MTRHSPSPRTPPGRALGSCAIAFLARLVLPAAYVLIVGVLPIRALDLDAAAAVGWLFLSVLVLPAVIAVSLVLRARKHRDRR